MAAGGSNIEQGYPTLRQFNDILMQRVYGRSTDGEKPVMTVLQTQVLDPNDIDNCLSVSRKDWKEMNARLERAEKRIEELEREKQHTGLIVVPDEVRKGEWHYDGMIINLKGK